MIGFAVVFLAPLRLTMILLASFRRNLLSLLWLVLTKLVMAWEARPLTYS